MVIPLPILVGQKGLGTTGYGAANPNPSSVHIELVDGVETQTHRLGRGIDD